MSSSPMEHVIEEARRLQAAGILDMATLNPQIRLALEQGGGAKAFDEIVARDSQPPQGARVPDGKRRLTIL